MYAKVAEKLSRKAGKAEAEKRKVKDRGSYTRGTAFSFFNNQGHFGYSSTINWTWHSHKSIIASPTTTNRSPHISSSQLPREANRKMRSDQMAGSRRTTVTVGSRRRYYSRPIPKRGQIKAGIAVGLAHTVASLFTFSVRRSSCSSSPPR
ncbi:hypothetical protein Sjap_000099 [Stephania japonica]|uniref:Uncharacterized protein n=1 Tax=Stephania japonica TaxID=461633 RepID=A0AAP0PS52_9MAGN